ncbi:hypothetical protein [Cytobacillus kochii]|uniref:hypothetical protein n=1 Tax=Cytobacillus kochii TaxID=859143 RepID=UPI00247FCD74|nr:hypothetical protein [Cytobacillus kochii]
MCSDLKLKEKGQPVDFDLYRKFSPVPMEIIDGNIFFTDLERENLLKLLNYNVGIKRTFKIIEE